jgi:hypothetical protein
MTRAAKQAVALPFALALAACGLFHSDFDIAVANRTANSVLVFANGEKIGEVGSNGTAAFTVEEEPSGHVTVDSAGGPTSPIPVVQVTFSAQDTTTGVLSAGATTTLVKDVTTYVDVAPCVLVGVVTGGPAPPCVSVSTTPTGSQVQGCGFSLSGSDRTFDATGGSGSVTVNTSSGCTWTATSNASFLTITSGASGTGTGAVVFQVAANTTGQARTASLLIAGQTFTINQLP